MLSQLSPQGTPSISRPEIVDLSALSPDDVLDGVLKIAFLNDRTGAHAFPVADLQKALHLVLVATLQALTSPPTPPTPPSRPPSSNDGSLRLWKLVRTRLYTPSAQLTLLPSDWACRNVPSLPTCNLFFRQLLVNPKDLVAPASELLGLPSNTSAEFGTVLSEFGVGVNPACMIPRMAAAGGASGSLGNIANIAVCGLSVIIAVVLAVLAGRRAAAVGRVEMRILFLMYALVQGAHLVDTGAFLRAGSTALTWVSAVHLGLVVGL